jgi:polyadenylate-binding protein
VNFHHVQDAERALDTMNFTDIKGRPCRIMWSQRDPTLRKTGVGNIFVKNLPASVDNKAMFDTFSVFGNILSCKVVNDETGDSKGYGYVHYETQEAAEEAIKKLNGATIDDNVVTVGLFLRRQERAGQSEWTNVYMKQFPLSWDEAKITELLSKYGTVNSVFLKKDEAGKSKGFAFADFADHSAAQKALEDLNGKSFVDETTNTTHEMYLNRAQKKAERVRENRSRIEAAKLDRINKFQGMNLYVKNVDDQITDDGFKEIFAPFGTITSARLMRDENGVSRGFGFVCFSSPEEATRAVSEVNGKMFNQKPIFVTLHQRKEHRAAHLQAAFGARGGPRFPMGQAPMPYMGMYMQPGQPMPPRQFMMGGGMMGRGAPRPMPGNFAGRGYPMPQYMGQQGGVPGAFKQRPGMVPQQQRRGMPGGRGPTGMPMPQQGGRGMPMQQQARMGQQSVGKFPTQVRSQPQSGAPMGQEGLNPMDLARLDPGAQKNVIGEQLYPMIQAHQPELAGKITGMLLEMDNGELLHLLESPEALASKVEEALAVLRAHAQA